MGRPRKHFKDPNRKSNRAGEKGGCLVGQGTPESIIKIKKSHTGKYLKSKLE